MQFRTLSATLLLALPLLAAAAPGRYDSTYQLRARDAEYYAERALEAREALLEAAIEGEVQKRVDAALEEREADADADAGADPEPAPSPLPEPEPQPVAEAEAEADADAGKEKEDKEVQKREEANRLWRRRGGTWGRRVTRDL